MSDYPMQDPYAQGPPPTGPRAGAKYEERPRSPPRDSRDAGSRGYVPPARPSNAPVATPSNVLGVFGLSIRTREEDLEAEFGRSGRVEKVVIVYDQRSGRSRGFGFVTLGSVPDAEKAIQDLNGMDLHGRRLRVDFSATTRPHDPTPGEYRGPRRIEEDFRGGRGGPAPYGSSRYEGGGDRYGGGGGSYGGRSDRYDDRRGGGGGSYSRDERYSSSRGGERSYGSSSYGDRYGSGGGGGGGDRYSSSRREDYRSSRDDRDRDYGREPRRRDSRSPDAAGARERSPARRERTPPRDEVKEDY